MRGIFPGPVVFVWGCFCDITQGDLWSWPSAALREGENNSHLQSKYHMPGTRPDTSHTSCVILINHKTAITVHVLHMRKSKTRRFEKLLAGKWKGRLNPRLSLFWAFVLSDCLSFNGDMQAHLTKFKLQPHAFPQITRSVSIAPVLRQILMASTKHISENQRAQKDQTTQSSHHQTKALTQ